jgi:hypothetical protein
MLLRAATLPTQHYRILKFQQALLMLRDCTFNKNLECGAQNAQRSPTLDAHALARTRLCSVNLERIYVFITLQYFSDVS